MMELVHYRELLKNLVLRDLRNRYKRSVLGFLWVLLNPLLMLAVYTMVFTTVMKIGVSNYAMFLFVALLPWTFTANAILRGASSIINGANLVKKIYFPRHALVMATVFGELINFLLGVVAVSPIFLLFHGAPGWSVLLLPVLLVIHTAFNLGIALLVSAITVYFRDLEHMLSILVLAWMYATPVLYSAQMVPPRYNWLFALNPAAPIISAYRSILFDGAWPTAGAIATAAIVSAVLLWFGWAVFARMQPQFAEEL